MGDNLHCAQCNVTVTGLEQFTQHQAGRRHLKKLKAMGITPEATPPIPPVVKKAVKRPAPAPAGSSTPPGGDFDEPEDSTELSAATKKIEGMQEYIPSSVDPVMKAIKANLLGKLPTKKGPYKGRCDVCNVMYTSESHETQHMTGLKHKKKMALYGDGGLNQATFFCSFCNVRVNSQAQMDQHREGLTHKKKVERAKKEQEEGPQPPPSKKKFVNHGFPQIAPTIPPTQPKPAPVTPATSESDKE